MKSMEMTAEEAKEYCGPCSNSEGDGPKYPWGLSIELNDGTLNKLGIDGLPEVGTVMKVEALATVVSVGMSQQQDGDKEQRASLQITDLGLTKATGDLAKRMYPDMD